MKNRVIAMTVMMALVLSFNLAAAQQKETPKEVTTKTQENADTYEFITSTSTSTSTSNTNNNTNINTNTFADENEFEGPSIKLNLDNAIKTTLSYSSVVKEAELKIEQAKIDFEQSESAMKKSRQRFGTMREDSLLYLQNITLQELSGQFAVANAQRNYEATLNSLNEDVIKYFFGLIQASDARNISDESIKLSEKIYEMTKKKYDLGFVSKQELLNAEMAVVEAKTKGYAAENAVIMSKMGLNIKLGFKVMQDISVDNELEYKELPVVDLIGEIKKAIETRTEIKALQFNKQLAQTKFAIADKIYTPNTFVYRESDLALRKATQDLENLKKSIELQVRTNYLIITQKYNEIKTLEKAVELAKTSLAISEVSYNAGIIRLTDVQGALLNLEAKKLELSKAILDYNISYLSFAHSTGVGSAVK